MTEALTDPDPRPVDEALTETAGACDPETEHFCPQCGYSLRGIGVADRCPECGLEIDRAGFGRSGIPWVYRRHIGRVVAYWRTVWLATVRPGKLAAEAAKPVSYADAQRFRLVTSAVAAAPVAVLLVGMMIWYGSTGFLNVIGPGALAYLTFGGRPMLPGAASLLNVIIPWEAGVTIAPVLPVALFVAALFVTGVGSYAFHPRALPVVRQNRAVALSQYACAPLFFLPVPAGAFMLVTMLQRMALDAPGTGFGPIITFFTVVGCVGLVSMAFLFLRSTLVLLWRTTSASAARVTVACLALPIVWTVGALVALVGLPWVVGFVRLVIASLRG